MRWSNWSGGVVADPTTVLSPRDEGEVAAAVRGVAERGGRVRPVGSGHSFTAVAAPTDVQLRLTHLTGVVSADPQTGRVRVRGGTPLHQLNRELDALGLALPNLGDIDRQSITGAISTGTHGTGAALPGLAAGVTGLRLVTADGQVREIGEDQPDLLHAAQVSLGALGIITEVELACVPAFTLRAVERPDRLSRVLPGLLELAEQHRHVELYWFPHTDRVNVKINDPLADGEPAEPLAPWRSRLDDELLSNTVFGAVNVGLARAPRLIPAAAQVIARALTERTYTARSHEVFCSPRRVRFFETEWALPRPALHEAMGALQSWIERSGEAISMPVEVRLTAADPAWLSMSHERDNVYLACHHHVSRDPRRYVAAVQEIMHALGGRPHWGKLHSLEAADLAALYPRHGDFVALRQKLDPQRVFTNPYLDRVLGA